MRRSFIALGALITAASIYGAAPARAEIDYPVCRSGGGDEGGYSMRCDYSTLEQCQATAAGIGGSCVMNPFYASKANPNSNANATYRRPARRIH